MSSERKSSFGALSPVEEYLYRSLDIPVDNQEAFATGLTEVFNEAFFDRDPNVIGTEIQQRLTGVIFSNGTEVFTPTAEEWRDGLVDFAARTVRHLEPSVNGRSDAIAGTMGQTIVVLLGMTKPDTQVGVTPNGGITREGQVLGHTAERTRLLLRYSAKLEESLTD